MKPSEAIDIVVHCISMSPPLPVFLTGEAGIGKSSIVKQAARLTSRVLLDERAVLLDPVDLRGVPHVDKATSRSHWAPPAFLPNGNSGATLLFLDELNRAGAMVQNACLSLTLDRHLGEYRLPDNCSVVAAGNPDTSRGTTKLSDALASRFMHLAVEPDLDDFCAYGSAHDFRPEVLAFVRFRRENLHKYDARATEKAFPNPRSWEFVSRVMAGNPKDAVEHKMYSGLVGRGAAGEFVAFLKMVRSLPTMAAIIRDPKGTKVPGNNEPGTLYAIASGLAREATKRNLAAIMTYLERMPRDFMICAVKDATARDSSLCETKEFIKFAAENAEIFAS
jgi:hypothetical protein